MQTEEKGSRRGQTVTEKINGWGKGAHRREREIRFEPGEWGRGGWVEERKTDAQTDGHERTLLLL